MKNTLDNIKYKNLNEVIEQKYKEEFKNFLKKNLKELNFNTWLCPNKIRQILEDLGFEYLDDFDSNGWDWDFYEYYRYKNKEYILSGNGYYGYLTFSKIKD